MKHLPHFCCSDWNFSSSPWILSFSPLLASSSCCSLLWPPALAPASNEFHMFWNAVKYNSHSARYAFNHQAFTLWIIRYIVPFLSFSFFSSSFPSFSFFFSPLQLQSERMRKAQDHIKCFSSTSHSAAPHTLRKQVLPRGQQQPCTLPPRTPHRFESAEIQYKLWMSRTPTPRYRDWARLLVE